MSLTSKITNYNNPDSIGSKLREKRIKPLLSMIHDIHEKNGCVNILDVGGTRQYWGILPKNFLEDKNVFITLLNLPSQNKLENEKRFTYLEGDACELSNFADYSFDIVHSNSVIEHVGDWNRMQQFSKEIKRLAKNYYVQTPNFWFPMEPHCMTPIFHWLPKPMRVSLIMKFTLGHWGKQSTVSGAVDTVDSARLLDKKMFRELFDEAEITIERLLFLPKSLIAVNRG
jgi:hypothetical protein